MTTLVPSADSPSSVVWLSSATIWQMTKAANNSARKSAESERRIDFAGRKRIVCHGIVRHEAAGVHEKLYSDTQAKRLLHEQGPRCREKIDRSMGSSISDQAP